MRFRRLSFVVGWAAIALLAIAGFAAFSDPDPTPDEIRVEAAAASLGHTSGSYAGLTFTLLGNSPSGVETATVTAESTEDSPRGEGADTVSSPDASTPGTISSSNGWLSEVEVRAIVSSYFEPEDVNRAIRVAWCESRFNPNAVDARTGGIGLFKHLPRYWEERASNAGFAGVDPTDPQASAAAAAWEVYEGGGWDVFTCRG